MTDEIKKDEVVEIKKSKRQERKVTVTTIAVNEGSALVEYLSKSGEVNRCYIPIEEVSEGLTGSEILEAGTPYGADFSGIVSQDVITALHNHGIWTNADVLGDRQQLLNALMVALLSPVLKKLTEFAGK